MSAKPSADPRRDCIHSWSPGRTLTDEEYLEQVKARFWAKVDKTPGHGPKGECWVWTGSRDGNGYGKLGFRFPGNYYRPVQAHRVAYMLTHGAWPENNGCHSCDFPPCVRPDHIWDGTDRENMRDAWKKGRMASIGVYQRPRPERTRRIRFNPAQIEVLRSARKAKGASIHDIAQLLDVDFSYVSKFENGHRPSLPLEKAHALVLYLGAEIDFSDCQCVEHGTAGQRMGREPRKRVVVEKVNPTLPHQRKILSQFWRELPEPRTDFYRADLLCDALRGQKVTDIIAGSQTYQRILRPILLGVHKGRKQIVRVAAFAGLSESEVFNVEARKAA